MTKKKRLDKISKTILEAKNIRFGREAGPDWRWRRDFSWLPADPELPGGVLTLDTPYRSEYEAGDPPEVEVSEGALFWRAVPNYGPRGLDGYTLWKGRSPDSVSWTLITSVREVPKILHGPNSLEELNEFIDLFLDGVELGDI